MCSMSDPSKIHIKPRNCSIDAYLELPCHLDQKAYRLHHETELEGVQLQAQRAESAHYHLNASALAKLSTSNGKSRRSLLAGAGGGADCEDLLGGLEAPPKKPREGAAGLGAGLARRALPPAH